MSEKSLLAEEMRLASEQATTINELQQFECCRYDGPTFLDLALEPCSRTEKEIRQLRKRITDWPQVPIYQPVRQYLDVLIRHCINDYVRPPSLHELPGSFETKVSPEALAMVLMDEQISRKELVAVAALIATETAPEKFAKGYSDKELHDTKIADVQKALSETLARAANSWGLDDVEFHSGVCSFRLSGGRIAVGNGPGDVRAVEQLLQFLKQPKSVATEEPEPDVHEPEQDNRVEFSNYLKRV